MEIIQNILGKKVIFIRFNPDTYKDETNTQIKSSWVFYRSKLKISSDKKLLEAWNKRLDKLKETIMRYTTEEPTESLTEIKLFYTMNLEEV